MGEKVDELRYVQRMLDFMVDRRRTHPFDQNEAANYSRLCQHEARLLVELDGIAGA